MQSAKAECAEAVRSASPDPGDGYLVVTVDREGRITLNGTEELAEWLLRKLRERGIGVATRPLGPCG